MTPAFPHWPTAEPLDPAVPDRFAYDDEDVPCPDCSTPVPLGALACSGCGLTLAEVADRIARGEAG